jgi:hypothetical protein
MFPILGQICPIFGKLNIQNYEEPGKVDISGVYHDASRTAADAAVRPRSQAGPFTF